MKADSTTDVNSESNVDGSQSEQVPTSSQDSKKKRGRRELSSEGSSSRGRSRVRSDKPVKRIKGRKRREQVVRWQVGIFWPLSKLSKFLAKQMKDRPCFRKPYVCDGVRGYLLDTSSEKKYGCPSGCAYVEDHAGDGVEYEDDKVLSSDLKNPEDIDTIWADIKSFKEVMTKPSEHTIAKNGPETPHAVLVASRPPLPDETGFWANLRWGGSHFKKGEKRGAIDTWIAEADEAKKVRAQQKELDAAFAQAAPTEGDDPKEMDGDDEHLDGLTKKQGPRERLIESLETTMSEVHSLCAAA